MRPFLVLLVVFGGFYALLLSFLYFYQDRMIYFPASSLWATPERLGLEFEDLKLPVGGESTHAWFVPAGNSAPVVLFCHGNAGNMADRLDLIESIHSAGLSTLIFDYGGYGHSSGSPGESRLYADADAAYRWLRDHGFGDSDIVLYGRSLGGAVAAYVAQNRPVRALVLESAFSSMADVAAASYPWVPVRLLLKCRYEAADYVKQVRGPVVVVHSRDDEIVPFELGQKLYDAAPETKRLIEVAGGHNYYPATPWAEIVGVDTTSQGADEAEAGEE